MKKIVCGLVGVIAAVNSASALTTEEIKQRCMIAENRVWDAKNQKCISKTPCKELGYTAYCNDVFKDVQVANSVDAKKLVDAYLKKHGTVCEKFDMSKAGVVGDDYIRCHLSDGGYLEFQFDDYNESIQSTANYGFAKGMCLVYGGNPTDMSEDDLTTLEKESINLHELPIIEIDGPIPNLSLTCRNVSESDCKAMYSGQSVYSKTGHFCIPYIEFRY